MSTLSQWQPYGEYVQSGMSDGRFMSAAYNLIAAGPPRLANMGNAGALGTALASGDNAQDQLAYPMGIVQSFTMGHNMNLSRVFEIGTGRSYFIPGRVVGQLGLQRVMYHGPSLLRVLYAYYQDLIPPTFVNSMYPSNARQGPNIPNPHDVKIPPGYENLFLNLASDLFTQPIGLLVLFKDSNEDTIGAGYFEGCWVPNHNLGFDANGVVMQESCGIQFERMVPVATQVVGLISGVEGGSSSFSATRPGA